MKAIKPHVTSEGIVDYYECSVCGWVYPFPRFVKDSEEGLPNREMAERAFAEHQCEKFPQRPKS
jgi:hypothetical protein